MGVQGNILGKKQFFLIFIKTNSDFGKKIFTGFSILHSTCQWERFEEIYCGEKQKKFFGFQILSEKFSYFWRKFSPGFSKQQFTSSVEHFNENLIFWKERFFNHFRTLTGNDFSFLAKNFWRVVKLQRTCLGKRFDVFWEESTIFYPVLFLSKNFSDFWQ